VEAVRPYGPSHPPVFVSTNQAAGEELKEQQARRNEYDE
jgi:hypothetical protein